MELVATKDLTMGSKEIAQLTGKDHKNVIRDIEKQLDELNISRLKFESSYKNRGKRYKCYNLPKKQVEILITGYSIKLRAAVIDRLHQLEAERVQPKELTILDYAKALIAQEEKHQIEKKFIKDKREATVMNRLAQLSTDEEIKRLVKESQKNCKGLINPKIISDLGDFQSAQIVNRALCALGLQEKCNTIKKEKIRGEWVTFKITYKLTEEGKIYGNKYINPINLRALQVSLRWSKSTIQLIDEYLEQ